MRLSHLAPLIFTTCLLLSGCVSFKPEQDLTRYYLLGSPRVKTNQNHTSHKSYTSHEPAPQASTSIGIRRVALPRYLETRRLLVRAGDHEVQLSAFDLWAEELSAGIARVVADTLERETEIAVEQPPLSSRVGPIDTTIDIEISEMAGHTDGTVELIASWTVRRDAAEEAGGPSNERRAFRAEWEPGNYASLVAAHTRNIESLARAIADSLR